MTVAKQTTAKKPVTSKAKPKKVNQIPIVVEPEIYVPQSTTTKITAHSRVSFKIKDTFYTVEFVEEREVPVTPDLELDLERQDLWDTVHGEVDRQVREIIAM